MLWLYSTLLVKAATVEDKECTVQPEHPRPPARDSAAPLSGVVEGLQNYAGVGRAKASLSTRRFHGSGTL